MGDSLPPPAKFDLISSYARRRGSDIEIVLAGPQLELPDGDVTVTLRRNRAVVPAVGHTEKAVVGSALVVRVPRADVRDGTWALSLDRPNAPRERVAARLLVQGERPLVLLWGAWDPNSAVPTRPRPVPARRRTAAAAGRVLDRALTVLPEQQATSIRSTARTVARRVVR